jgi:hypothetical protein
MIFFYIMNSKYNFYLGDNFIIIYAVGTLKFAKQSLKPEVTCMIIEPMANDKLEDNLNLIGRTFYAASTLVCVPNSLADNGLALGAQAGEKRIRVKPIAVLK